MQLKVARCAEKDRDRKIRKNLISEVGVSEIEVKNLSEDLTIKLQSTPGNRTIVSVSEHAIRMPLARSASPKKGEFEQSVAEKVLIGITFSLNI